MYLSILDFKCFREMNAANQICNDCSSDIFVAIICNACAAQCHKGHTLTFLKTFENNFGGDTFCRCLHMDPKKDTSDDKFEETIVSIAVENYPLLNISPRKPMPSRNEIANRETRPKSSKIGLISKIERLEFFTI